VIPTRDDVFAAREALGHRNAIRRQQCVDGGFHVFWQNSEERGETGHFKQWIGHGVFTVAEGDTCWRPEQMGDATKG